MLRQGIGPLTFGLQVRLDSFCKCLHRFNLLAIDHIRILGIGLELACNGG